MGVSGDFASVQGLKRALRKLPTTIAHDVAQRVAPALTQESRDAFGGGRTVYGEPRPLSVDGTPLTLRKTGTVAAMLSFTATGTIVRAVLATDYARFLIGKYLILPNGLIPASWSTRLTNIVKTTEVGL